MQVEASTWAHLLDSTALQTHAARQRLTDTLTSRIDRSTTPELECRQICCCLIDSHDQQRLANGAVCRRGTAHRLLSVAAIVLFRKRCSDSRLVCRLLLALNTCDDTLESVLEGAVFGARVTFLLSGRRSELHSDTECLQMADYFLYHATKVDLRVAVASETYCVVDVPLPSYGNAAPIMAASQLQRIPALQLLLQYGAKVHYKPTGAGLIHWTTSPPIKCLCAYLNDQVPGPYNQSAVDCLQLLMAAAAPSCQLQLFHTAEPPATQGACLHYTVAAENRQLMVYVEVLSLKRICIGAIRHALIEAGKYPHTVRCLPLPVSLQDCIGLKQKRSNHCNTNE